MQSQIKNTTSKGKAILNLDKMMQNSSLIRKMNDAIIYQPTNLEKDDNESEFSESEFLVQNHNNNTSLPIK